MRQQAPPRPHKRAGIWYLIRRVPRDVAHLDKRDIVKVSTGIAVADDPRGIRAARAVAKADAELQAYWRGLQDGQSAEVRLRFDAAQRRANRLGLSYLPAAELAGEPVTEILDRLRILTDRNRYQEESEVAAVLGGEERPRFKVSDLVAEFEALQKASLRGKSENQVRKWRNPKLRAATNLLKVTGDKLIEELTRSDGIAFRKWWMDRIEAEELDINTANKDFGHVSKMLGTINIAHDLGLPPVFSRLRIEGGADKQRAAFTAEHVQKKILASGALDGLNDEARHIVWLVADSGLRPSEACNLGQDTIHLNAEVPFARVRSDGRQMKTAQSERDIPLVGVALEAAKLHPSGFPRYRDKADSLSNLVNKVLENHNLLPTDDHSFYSLRHTFEDRLTAVEAPEKVVAALMGHKWHRPRYGAGPSLAQKQEWLAKIAYSAG